MIAVDDVVGVVHNVEGSVASQRGGHEYAYVVSVYAELLFEYVHVL